MATKIAYDPASDQPKRLVTIPMTKGDVPVAALAVKFHSSGYAVWQLVALYDIDARQLGRVLGLCIVDEAEPVLPIDYMPRLPPTLRLLQNGELRTGRGFLLAPWVIAEANRIGQVLEKQQADYLGAVSIALNQGQTEIFTPLKPGEVFKDSTTLAVRIGPRPDTVDVDVSQSERVRFGLRWDQVARQDYRRNRYLVLLNEQQLGRRVEDIMGNVHIVDPKGLISVDSTDPLTFYWLRLLAEVDAELTLRFGPYPAGREKLGVDPARLPRSLRPGLPGAGLNLRSSKSGDEQLVKYGKRQHLAAMLHAGIVRIAPASSYGDPSLNPSVNDDELRAEILSAVNEPFGGIPPGTMLLPYGRRKMEARLESDYHVYCMADTLSRRLFLDFEAECCLVIHDRAEFLKRASTGMAEKSRGARLITGALEYYDPLMVNIAEVRLPLSKHFRYAYQREFRMAWLPSRSQQRLQPVEINIGGLTDIAELVSSSHAEDTVAGT